MPLYVSRQAVGRSLRSRSHSLLSKKAFIRCLEPLRSPSVLVQKLNMTSLISTAVVPSRTLTQPFSVCSAADSKLVRILPQERKTSKAIYGMASPRSKPIANRDADAKPTGIPQSSLHSVLWSIRSLIVYPRSATNSKWIRIDPYVRTYTYPWDHSAWNRPLSCFDRPNAVARYRQPLSPRCSTPSSVEMHCGATLGFVLEKDLRSLSRCALVPDDDWSR